MLAQTSARAKFPRLPITPIALGTPCGQPEHVRGATQMPEMPTKMPEMPTKMPEEPTKTPEEPRKPRSSLPSK